MPKKTEGIRDLNQHIANAKRSASIGAWYDSLKSFSEGVQCLPEIRYETTQSSELEEELDEYLERAIDFLAGRISETQYLSRERKKELQNELKAVIRIKNSPHSTERAKIEAFTAEQTLRWVLEPPEMKKAVRYMSPRKFIRIKEIDE